VGLHALVFDTRTVLTGVGRQEGHSRMVSAELEANAKMRQGEPRTSLESSATKQDEGGAEIRADNS
jgi:hypothetical protein